MYKEFYLMQKEPFDSHPSPELFYKSNVHQTAWHYLVQGIKQHEPILVIAGEYGAGKTLLFLKLVRLLETKGRLPIVSVPSPTYNFVMILEKIVERLLNISTGSIDAVEESKLQQAVYEYFENTENRSPIYVVIDDAQEFSYSFINKLRLFASYNCGGFFPIRLIFFAHHSFLKMLRYKKLVALGQRIKRIYHLKPLNFEETKEYIYYRLIHSGATGTPIFNDDAIALIENVSGGNPRLINNVCDNCLLFAGEKRVNIIDQSLVCLAIENGNLPGIENTEKQSIHCPHEFSQLNPAQRSQNMEMRPQIPHGQSMSERPSPGPYLEPEPKPVPQSPGYMPGMESQPPNFSNLSREPSSDFHGTSGLWTRYGKIGVIILLVVIALFLLTILFRSGNSDYIGNATKGDQKIIKDMPVSHYGIYRKVPLQKVTPVSKSSLKMIVPRSSSIKQPMVGTGRRYAPVLLTDNLGS